MLQETPGLTILQMSRHLQTVINKRLEAYRITANQVPFLLVIARHKGLSQDDISNRVQIDKITTSKMVKKLVEAGYVKKEDDGRDRRFSRVFLTDHGRELLPPVRRILDEITAILVSGSTEEEAQWARACLRRMLSNIARTIDTMKAEQQFLATVEDLKAGIAALPDIVDAACIQQTARRLESVHYAPILILPVEGFFDFSKTDALREIDRVTGLTEEELRAQGVEIHQTTQDIRLEQIRLLIYHFKLLTRLRQDDAAAWDEIDELYRED